jgi:hypothetical protein
VKLELAWNPETACDVLADWKAQGVIGKARTSIALDWAFIPLYSSTLSLVAIVLGRAVGADSHSTADAISALAAYAAWTAGVLDVIENVGMLRVLGCHTEQPTPLLTSIASAVKWTLLGAAGLGVLALAVWSLVGLA